ncbi:hypothetical protein RB195_015579 [Necator americanus]|uniref:Uncharacterized protein n=1 Tax=Necator americanus TaxID=51031 RepID=A0ABR1E581_NECAM
MNAAEIDVHFSSTDVILSLLSPFSGPRPAFKARASGVLLVAGVGSYCAYRICTKYLGSRFVWMLLESARFDNIATADRRLLYASGFPDEDERDDMFDDKRSRCTDSRTPSEMSIIRLSRYPRKSRGLFAIRQPKSGREGVLRRPSTSDQSGRSRGFSSSMSDRSASLRIVFEGQQDCWEDEFAAGDPQPGPSIISRVPLSPSKMAPSASVGDLGSVFDDVLSMSSAVEQSDLPYDEVVESDDPIHDDLMRMKCMGDSKYMYRSVIVASSEFGSDAGSYGGSVMSSKSNLQELRKRFSKAMDPQGLWDLTQETPSTSRLKVEPNEMTDSGFSRSTQSKHSHEHRSLFDSAIGGELYSSEDESVDKPEKHVLIPLRESDAISLVSLEWCDDGLRERDGVANGVGGDLNTDFASSRESVAGSSKSPPFSVCTLHRPKDSRDLMVYACEKFQPYSPQFKKIQHLYHRRRLRRIGPSPRTADETLRLFMSCALYHGYNILQKPSSAVEKRFDSCASECNFLHRWSGATLEQMREDLHCLSDTKFLQSSPVNESQTRALALLVVLAARDVYNGKLCGDASCSWFSKDSPADVMMQFERNLPLDETCWRLLGSCCDVSVEVLDFSTQRTETIRFGVAPKCITWLRVSQSSAPQPLFYVPDD